MGKKHYYYPGGHRAICGRIRVQHTFSKSEVTCKDCKKALRKK